MTKKHTAAKVGKAKTDRDIKLVLAEHVTAIRRLGKQTVANIIEIGRRLTECKDIFGPRGGFNSWIDNHFGWSERHARNFMHVYELAESKSENFSELKLPISAFYLLAAPSTPEPVRDEIITRAKGGEKIKHAEVKKRVAKARPPTKRSSPAAKASSSPAAKAVAEIAAMQATTVFDQYSPAKVDKLEREVEKLQEEKRALEIKNIGLKSEVEDLTKKTAADERTGADGKEHQFRAGSANRRERYYNAFLARAEIAVEDSKMEIEPVSDAQWRDAIEAAETVVAAWTKTVTRLSSLPHPAGEAKEAPVTAVTAPTSAPADDGLDIPASLRREVTKH